MNLDKVTIAGIEYKIEFHDDAGMGGHIGLADFNRQVIKINSMHTAATQRIAIAHEIIHIVSDAWGLKLNEEQVKIGTHALISFMRDNPDFLEAIK